MSGDAQPSSNQRATDAHPPPSPPIIKEKAAIGALCVVCGDRACSHLYYGVAACHGCKCFFWRTVKSKLNYSCRYGGNCSISTAGRNACRYCRFHRCLFVGMKMEAVKMDRKLTKRKKEKMDGDESDDGGNPESLDYKIDAKRARSDNHLLISSLLLIDKTSSDGNAKLSSLHFVQPSLQNLLEEPELLDGFRSEMSYRATRQADAQLCYDTERRLVTWAIDWCRQTAEIGDVHHTNDKIALLRACCAPLVLLELGCQSSQFGNSDTRVPLCNNSFLTAHQAPPSVSFINYKTIQSLNKWTQRELKPLCLKAKEIVLLKTLVILNPDAPGLSQEAESSIRMLRDRVHTTLFQMLMESSEPVAAASRLSQILLLIPQLTLMGVDVIEQVRVRNTFNKHSAFGEGILFWQLYGDIFDDQNSDDSSSYLEHSASCSPTDSQYSTTDSS
ncbi:Protein CBR-NHR-97 [Caenorhabditis briggsae]|uniref:Protein CBR-NHR-97 n=1 Tax=Caenorhabditis briggsae TaxID=6238 RepID=A8XL71_CAEBR|nr:Protein CBR-NHR-97 [Caenorhabditis briggsae]CAP33396.1 Protein CBR-NHR-97 [Caenorhabditis briggsae]